jgi:hypothetical protein
MNKYKHKYKYNKLPDKHIEHLHDLEKRRVLEQHQNNSSTKNGKFL